MIVAESRTDCLGLEHKNLVVGRVRRELENNPLFRNRSNLIRIDEYDGHLVLEGNLPSYYLKQMLQTVLRDVDGVDCIENRVAVHWPTTK